jgi:hypothetical protein
MIPLNQILLIIILTLKFEIEYVIGILNIKVSILLNLYYLIYNLISRMSEAEATA